MPLDGFSLSLKEALIFWSAVCDWIHIQHSEDRLMIFPFTADVTLFARALVVGAFGGVGLLLGYRFSTRGAIMFPIYGAILLITSLVMAQFPGLSFAVRFGGLMLAMSVSTAIAMVGVLYATARRMQARAKRGLPPVEGHAPWWSAPFVFASVAAASAGVAILIR